MQSIAQILAQELNQKQEYIKNVISLLDEGNTIPFIARYRKEMHGTMDDTTLRNLETRLTYLRNLEQRRNEIKKAIENQGKLTQELSASLDAAQTMAEVEDLYRPYKQKRRTRGSIAREKGLAPLAEAIFAQDGQSPELLAKDYVNEEAGVSTVEDALAGASDIIAEDLSDRADIRKALREMIMRRGSLVCKAADTAADLTIMEEGNELIDRIRGGGKLPLITSCSPGWIKFCEHNYPDMLDNLSTCKSPHQMFGAILKSYYAEKKGIDPKDIVVVSVMPCTAKKFEAARPEMEVNGIRDVDIVITTRELSQMIYDMGLDFTILHDSEFDNPFGEATGAGHIFGVTGGVMEAALRTVVDILNGTSTDSFEYSTVRGLEGIRIAKVKAGNLELRAAVAHGLGNARKLMDAIRAGEKFDFVEIMACPGGCVNGGGQPLQLSEVRSWIDIRAERAKALYSEDNKSFIRKSHNNPAIKKLYKEYLGMAGGSKAHQLLHTHYHPRKNYGD